MVIRDINGSLLTPEIRGRGVVIVFIGGLVELAFLGGLALSIVRGTAVPPFAWALPALILPLVLWGIVAARYRPLAATAASVSQPPVWTALFGSAVISPEVSEDGVIHAGRILGPGWLAVDRSVVRVFTRESAPEVELEIFAAALGSVECLRLWGGVIFDPMARLVLADGRAIDFVPCVAGLPGLFGYGRRRFASMVRRLEAATTTGDS